MAKDALLVLASAVTATGTVHETGLSIPGGIPRRGLVASIDYSAASAATAETVQFSIDYSPNAGTTWFNSVAQAEPITLTPTTAAAEINLPFNLPSSNNSDTAPQIRLSANFSGSDTAPTIVFSSYLGNAYP